MQDWVGRVNAKIATMKFENKDVTIDNIADVVADEIVTELSGVPDDELNSVARKVVEDLPDIKFRETPPPPVEDDDDDMPGLISTDYSSIHNAMYSADNGTYHKICNMVDDLYEAADRQDKDLEVEQDDKGRTLLHWALLFRCPSAVIQTLINAYPDILTYPDDDGWLPLHYAAKYSMTLDVVEDVYSIYPDAVLELNDAGIPPALVARYGGAPKEVVQFLEDKMKATKAAAKIVATRRDEEEVDDPINNTFWMVDNAKIIDMFLAASFCVGVLLLAIILGNVFKI